MEYVEMDDDVLPAPYEPGWEALDKATDEEPFSEAAFHLIKECGQLLTAVAGAKPRDATNRNQAVLMGLVVRMAKLLRLVVRDLSNRDVEQQLSMSRQIMETAANLRWLMHDDGSGSNYDMFIEAGLGAERNRQLVIDKNIKDRGGEVLHIEKRMMATMENTAKAAGINDLSKIRSGKALAAARYPNIEKRIEELSEIAYFAYRATSSEVHGTWPDLITYHLEYNGAEFAPNFDKPPVRPQAATSLVSIVCVVIPSYLDSVCEVLVALRFLPLFSNLDKRKTRLTDAHERFLEQSN